MSHEIELKIKFKVPDVALDNLRLTPDRYARYIRDSVHVFLTSRSPVPHDNVEVTIEH